MTVREFADMAALRIEVGGDSLDRIITGGYCGDLLSWVMGRAEADQAWMTVIGNVNAIAVAVLADIACIILCENAVLDDEARAKAIAQNVPVLATELPTFAVAQKLAGALI